jgi:uncharacterized protein
MTIDPNEIFQCTQCGDCCKGYGGTYVTDDDIRNIASFLKIDPADFRERYCEYSGNKPLLAQKKDGFCVFFEKLCTIHPVKPRMCGAWPFINSILVDVANWRAMAASCPGMRTDVDDETIRACVARELERQSKE